MHDLLIGLLFIAMFLSPAIITALPKSDSEEDENDHGAGVPAGD